MNKSPKARPPRVPYLGQVTVSIGDDVHRCQGINLSVSGILLLAPRCRRPELPVLLSLPYARPPPVCVHGVVVRETGYCGHEAWGIQFQRAASRDLEILKAFVRRKLGVSGTNNLHDPMTRPSAEFDPLPSTNELQQVYKDAIEEIHRQEIEEARHKAEAKKRVRWLRRG